MTTAGHLKRVTQNRIVALFRDELNFRYLGDRTERGGNSSIDAGMRPA